MYNEEQLIRLLHDTATREKAFETLVREFQEQLYWQIRRMVQSHDDTDDIMQNVFLKAWQGIDSFRGDAKLATWLYRIANNETISFLRRQRQTTISISPSGEGEDEEHPAVRLESDPYFDGDETERKLQQAVQSLPPKQRQVFNMKYFQEMKYEDISRILGTSTGALKASYHHAVLKITGFFGTQEI